MKRTRNRWIALTLLAVLVVPATLAATTTTTITATYNAAPNAAQASELLKEVRTLARQVSETPDVLALSAGSNRLHWMTHASRLNQAKDFESFRVSEAHIESHHRHLLVATDGEVNRMALPLHYRIRPGALRVLVPATKGPT